MYVDVVKPMLLRLVVIVGSLHAMSSRSTLQSTDAVLLNVLTKLTNLSVTWCYNMVSCEVCATDDAPRGNFGAGAMLHERL